MKNKLNKIIIAISTLMLGVLTFTPVFAETCTDICNCPGISAEIRAASGCPGSGSTADFSKTIQTILNSVIGILGTVAVIFIIVGAIQYMTSAGDPGKTKKAKDTILYACIGLAIAALAFAITNFAISTINSGTKCPDGKTWDATTKTCK